MFSLNPDSAGVECVRLGEDRMTADALPADGDMAGTRC